LWRRPRPKLGRGAKERKKKKKICIIRCVDTEKCEYKIKFF
jgi:hypothetical protein